MHNLNVGRSAIGLNNGLQLDRAFKSCGADWGRIDGRGTITALVFFDEIKAVAVMRKGFQKDKVVLNAEIDEIKELATRANIP